MADKRIQLESVRGLAAMLVVLYHLPKWHSALDAGLIDNAYLLVQLFFVLSGYVIYTAYAGRLSSAADVGRFQFLRFGRLYPVHLVFLAAFVLIECAKYFAARSGAVTLGHTAPFRENSVEAIGQHLLLVQAMIPHGNFETFNVPAWSISVEFYTYLLFALCAWLCRGARDGVFVALAVGTMGLVVTGTTFGLPDFMGCLAGFFLGCTVAFTVPRWSGGASPWWSTGIAAAMVLFVQFKVGTAFDAVIYVLSAALLAALLLSREGIVDRILLLRPVQWLGQRSYSIYMAHSLVIVLVSMVLKRVLGRPEALTSQGKYAIPLSGGETWCVVALTIVAVWLLAEAVYRHVETPWRQRSRRVVFGKPAASALTG